MSIFKYKISSLFQRLSFVLLLYVITRVLMYLFNKGMYDDIDFLQFLKLSFYGLRFDLSVIFITNLLLIFLYLLPFSFSYTKGYNRLLAFVFVLINSLIIIANMSDIIYYRFTLKRTTIEFLSMFKEDQQMFSLIPSFIVDFWYITIITLVLIAILVWWTKRTFYNFSSTGKFVQWSWKSSLLSLVIVSLSIIGMRGGMQLRPLSIISATKYANVSQISLVLNTPFTIVRTIGKTKITVPNYFPLSELDAIIDPIHQPNTSSSFRPLNVVVIIMESMSKEHSAFLNPSLQGKGFTPFLDSIMQQALVCTQAFANGRKSIEGIPAILASFPTLFDDAFISSPYASNELSSLANILKQKQYNSSFFHGGNNGTMGFDNFVKSVGFDRYYGRTEYNNDQDFDGKWGIFDDKFFEYISNVLTKKEQPFLAGIFSLSAHHPYNLPVEFQGKFPKGILPIQMCIAYSDFALGRFFQFAKKEDWFNNTLFVITADHTSEVADAAFNNSKGRYAIPIVYYMPADSLKGIENHTTQQLDILPSILDYLHYDKPYYSLGNSILSKSVMRESYSYSSGIYQYISDSNCIQSDMAGLESFLGNSLNSTLISDSSNNELSILNRKRRLLAIIQRYNYDMVNDNMNLNDNFKN